MRSAWGDSWGTNWAGSWADHTVNFSTTFSSTDYCVVALSSTVTHPCQDGSAPVAGSVRIHTRTPGPSSVVADAGRYFVAGFGDQ